MEGRGILRVLGLLTTTTSVLWDLSLCHRASFSALCLSLDAWHLSPPRTESLSCFYLSFRTDAPKPQSTTLSICGTKFLPEFVPHVQKFIQQTRTGPVLPGTLPGGGGHRHHVNVPHVWVKGQRCGGDESHTENQLAREARSGIVSSLKARLRFDVLLCSCVGLRRVSVRCLKIMCHVNNRCALKILRNSSPTCVGTVIQLKSNLLWGLAC